MESIRLPFYQIMVWLLPLLIFFAGLIPGVVDSFLWKALGAFLFLAVIGSAGYGLMGGYEREPKKLRKKAPAAAAANLWEMIQRRANV